MIVIGKTTFEFEMEDEKFAFGLYGRWDNFYYSGFQRVADEVLSSEDKENTVIQIDRLCLDLGTFKPDEFYDQFPLRLAGKLKVAVHDLLNDTNRKNVKEFSIGEGSFRALTYYLLYGHLRWDCIEEEFCLEKYISRFTAVKSEEWLRFLRFEGRQEGVRKRLVYQLDDRRLEALISLTEPEEAVFINRYTFFLIRYRRVLPGVGIAGRDYRNAVWWLVLAYVWGDCKGYFSRKELVRYTLGRLAARLAVPFSVLVEVLTEGMDRILAGDVIRYELADILKEIRQEEERSMDAAEPGRERNDVMIRWKSVTEFLEKEDKMNIRRNTILGAFITKVRGIMGGLVTSNPFVHTNLEDAIHELKKQLEDVRICRRVLQDLGEKEICRLVELIFPWESRFIITYAGVLEQEKEKNMFEGKAGDEFRVIKWEFIFALLPGIPAGGLDRKRFVAKVLERLAAHYGIDYFLLLGYFYRDKDSLPVWLSNILRELECERLEQESVCLPEDISGGEVPEEAGRLRDLLGRSVSCRRLLGRLEEKDIFRIVRMLIPQEGEFILDYAGELGRGKEKGMFEGRAGSEFELLKWEFIFRFVLRDPFNRKYFVLQTLQELGAHYGLEVKDLLCYFYHSLNKGRSGRYGNLADVISELWQEVREERPETQSLLQCANKEEQELEWMRDYLLTGFVPEAVADIYVLFIRLKNSMPEKLSRLVRSVAGRMWMGEAEQAPETVRMNVALLEWLLEEKRNEEGEDPVIGSLLCSVRNGSLPGDVRKLRAVLDVYLAGCPERCDEIIETEVFREPDFSGKDVAVLLRLFAGFRQKEVARLLYKRRAGICKLLVSDSRRSRGLVQKMRVQMQWIPGLAEFVKELIGEEGFMKVVWGKGGNALLPGRMNAEVLRMILNGTPKWKAGCRIPKKLLEDKQVQEQVKLVLHRNTGLQRLWIEKMGGCDLRQISSEVLQLEGQLSFSFSQYGIWEVLAGFGWPEYADFSADELYTRVIRQVIARLDDGQRRELWMLIDKNQAKFPLWKDGLRRLGYTIAASGPVKPELIQRPWKSEEADEPVRIHRLWKAEEVAEPVRAEVRNAGLVLLAPWFKQLFAKLGLLQADGKGFVDVQSRIRAVFILQGLVYGKWRARYREYDLLLNRILTGLTADEVLPDRLKLTRKEKRTIHALLKVVIQYWNKLEHASVKGLRSSFLEREGLLEEREEEWVLTVNRSGIDVLMGAIPWTFSVIKLDWMGKMIRVEWG